MIKCRTFGTTTYIQTPPFFLKHKAILEIPNLNLCNPKPLHELQLELWLSRGIWKLKSQIRFGQIRIKSWKSGRGGYEDLHCSTRRPCQ